MVDFSKRLAKQPPKKLLDPIAIYDTLDRASDKGPLRPVQEVLLQLWQTKYRNERDVIVKLHTGQGKTLIGQLMLQSKLNEDGGPVVYLCPNKYLINQTCSQAEQFGVKYCTSDGPLPDDFLSAKSMLITSVQKLFNGLTKFKTGHHSIDVAALLMDDCHACIDVIRDSFTIKLGKDETAFNQLTDLFAESLESQGTGTYAEIRSGDADAILPVPYWDWVDKHGEVVGILSKVKEKDAVKYAWPLIKDSIQHCQCIVSGGSLEIAPYLPPLDLFGSYYKAKHRFFMSATITDDSFLVKGLRLSPETIRTPLAYEKERWSGEKMILIPSLIDESLDRSTIVKTFGPPKERKFGTVVLAPSFKGTLDWKGYGATIATKETIDSEIEKLRRGHFNNTLVIVNRYDGIDLPDQTCRILVFDSRPYSDSLIDRYAELCRPGSEVTAMRLARTIEQGLGRSVRGEKDYSVIILIGAELIRTIRSSASRKHLSSQTRAQIGIGLDIADMAKEEETGKPVQALINLVNQCLWRDAGWKDFYAEKMDALEASSPSGKALEVFQLELEAEIKFQHGSPSEAIKILQVLVDTHIQDDSDKGWYMQEMARYKYSISKTESNERQLHAHQKNRFLMKPRNGMQVDKLVVVSQRRMANIIEWIKSFGNYEQLSVVLEDILSRLQFGTKADRFERAFDEIGRAIGFSAQRPEKEWKEGPDNLWGLRDTAFLLAECKSEVKLDRAEINKDEAAQMNTSCVWFDEHYPGMTVKKLIIIPINKLSKAAALPEGVEIMRRQELMKFTANVRAFFAEFKSMDFQDLSEEKVQQLVDAHGLSVDAILKEYSKKVIRH